MFWNERIEVIKEDKERRRGIEEEEGEGRMEGKRGEKSRGEGRGEE